MDTGIIESFVWDVAHIDFAGMLSTAAFFFVAAVVAWGMYKGISRRDIFQLRVDTPLNRALHLAKYVFLLPAWTVMWFIIYAVTIAILAQSPASSVLLGAAVVITGVRVAAYVHSDFAEEIASLLPFTLLAGVMLSPEFVTPSTIAANVSALFSNGVLFWQSVLFLVIVEWVLRLALWARDRSLELLDGRYLLPFGRILSRRR
ncbi:MAG: hypothetical protein QXF55_00045 [Candidatus Aenigmatarchaeota archaeon]